MKLMKTAAIVTLMTGCAFTSLGVPARRSVNLLDLFRKKRRRWSRRCSRRCRASVRQRPSQKQAARPLPKVTSPQYYTYKAEPLRRIATAKLVDPVVTGSVRSDVLPPAPSAAARRCPPVSPRCHGLRTGGCRQGNRDLLQRSRRICLDRRRRRRMRLPRLRSLFSGRRPASGLTRRITPLTCRPTRSTATTWLRVKRRWSNSRSSCPRRP